MRRGRRHCRCGVELETFWMASILVTGSAGFIGAILVPRLLQEGHSVTALDHFGHKVNSLAACCADPKFDAVRGDARDIGLMRRLLAKHDAVIPLAAVVGAPACD